MTTTTEIQKPDRQAVLVKNAWDLLKDQKKNIAAVLPKHITPDRMAMVAFTAMRKAPKLLECSRESLVGSLLTAAQLGLEPSGPLGHGALIPYWNNRLYGPNKGGYECQFQPMYQGLLELARRSNLIKDVQLRAVYEGDQYSYRFGLDPDITHIPLEGPGVGEDRKPTHVYCIIRFMNGGVQWDQMSYEQGILHGIRYSPSWDRTKKEFKPGSVWADNPLAMIQKTILKRVLKLCPKSTELAAALNLEDAQDAGQNMFLEPGTFELLSAGEQQTPPPEAPPDAAPTRGTLNLDSFKAGTQENRGHGQERLDQVAASPPPPAPPARTSEQTASVVEQQLADSMAVCDSADFAEIEHTANAAGLSVEGRGGVAAHVMGTMGFKEYMHLTKGRKGEVMAWIRAVSRGGGR